MGKRERKPFKSHLLGGWVGGGGVLTPPPPLHDPFFTEKSSIAISPLYEDPMTPSKMM